MDPSTESYFESTVTAQVTWYCYNNLSYDSKTFTETFEFETSVETGDRKIIETEIGAFEAVPLTMMNRGSVKKWWLTKGIGLIQLEYSMADYIHIAKLDDTNIFSFSEESRTKKAALNSLPSSGHHIRKKFSAPRNTPERTREICRFLQELCPR